RNPLLHLKFFFKNVLRQKGYPLLRGQKPFLDRFSGEGHEQFSESKSPPYRGVVASTRARPGASSVLLGSFSSDSPQRLFRINLMNSRRLMHAPPCGRLGFRFPRIFHAKQLRPRHSPFDLRSTLLVCNSPTAPDPIHRPGAASKRSAPFSLPVADHRSRRRRRL